MKSISFTGAYKALQKTGAPVQHDSHTGQYWIKLNGHIVTFYRQDDRAIGVSVRSIKDKDDPNTDYFPGTYCTTLKSAIALAQE